MLASYYRLKARPRALRQAPNGLLVILLPRSTKCNKEITYLEVGVCSDARVMVATRLPCLVMMY